MHKLPVALCLLSAALGLAQTKSNGKVVGGLERLAAPRVPIHRILSVLQQIGALFPG